MDSSEAQLPARETIEGVAERLFVWSSRAPKGLARAEFVDETARLRAVARLRERLDAEGIPLTEIDLPAGLEPAMIARWLIDALAAAPAGVVSISGFGAAMPGQDPERQQAYYALNFNRENLARPGLRQVWWMPAHIAEYFVQRVGDLNSWFIIKLRLSETVPPVQSETGLSFGQRAQYRLIPAENKQDPAQARESARRLAERFSNALRQDAPLEQAWKELVLPALRNLEEADLREEAETLRRELLAEAEQSGRDARGLTALTEESQLKAAIEEAERLNGPNDPAVANALDKYGQWLFQWARYKEAEPIFRRALAIHEAAFGPDHPNVATSLNSLAKLLLYTNRLAEAEPLFRRALSIHEAVFGPDHPAVANTLSNLAQLLQATNRLAEAEPLYRRALAIREASLGPDHSNVATSLNNLATLLKTTNRPAEAEHLLRRAIAIMEAALGPNHPDVATCINNLGALLQETNRLADAEPLLNRALAIREAAFGPNHHDVANSLAALGWNYLRNGKLEEGEPLLRRALAILEDNFSDPPHPHRLKIKQWLDELEARKGCSSV